MKYFFIASLFLSMAAVGLTISCYICVGCNSVTQSQLQSCSSTSFNACVTEESSGPVVRRCGSSASGCTGNGCTSTDCTEVNVNGNRAKRCTCQPGGCNGQTVPETTILASTESPTIRGSTIRCYSCVGCNTVTQSQLKDCPSTSFDACSMVVRSGYVLRSCSFSATGIGCTESGLFGINARGCTCDTDGCNGKTVPETTTLTSTESPTIRCYSCVGCNTVTQSQLQDCPSTFSDACLMVEISGYVLRSCDISELGTGCTKVDLNGVSANACRCQTDGCNGQTTTSSGGGAPKGNIVGSLIAVAVGKILM